MRKLTIILLSFIVFQQIPVFGQMNGFIFDMAFCDNSQGDNPKNCFVVCQGGTVFVKNLSTFNNSCNNSNSPSNSQPLTGTINIWVNGGANLAVSYSVTNAPGGSWNFNEVLAVPLLSVPVSGTISGTPCGNGLKDISIKYFGSDVSPFFCSGINYDYMKELGYAKTNSLPATNAGVDVSICTGSQVVLTAGGTGTPTWTYGGSSCVNCPTLTVGPLTTTTYTLTIVNSAGCSKSDNVTVTVLPKPKPILSNYTLCPSDPMPILNPGTFSSYLWTYNGNPVQFSQVLHTSNYGFGIYSVTVTNSYGCSNSTTSQVLQSNTWMGNANFNYTSSVVGSNVQISATGVTNTNNTWQLYNSNASCTQGTLISQQNYNNGLGNSHTFPFVSVNNYYIIKHTASKLPCLSIDTKTACVFVTSSGRFAYQINDGVVNNEQNLSVFPNPSKGLFNIESHQPLNSISIYDISGREVKKLVCNNQANKEVDIMGFANGIYILKASGDGFQNFQRIIVE